MPVTRVKEFLEHLQMMVYNIAEMRANLDPSKKGAKGDNIRRACDLNIVGMEFESATFALEPPPPEELLFKMDVGADALKGAFDVFQKFGQNDFEGLIKALPDEHHRSKIIHQAREAIPPNKTGFHLTAATVQQEIKEVSRPEAKSLRIIIPEEKLDKAEPPVAEKYIDAKGFAMLDEDEHFVEWKEILSLEELHVLPLEYVDGEQLRYNFRESLTFRIEREETLTILLNEDLGIFVGGASIEEAFKALGAEFDFLWDEYANEEDKALHPSGKTLKDTLLNLIVETPIHD